MAHYKFLSRPRCLVPCLLVLIFLVSLPNSHAQDSLRLKSGDKRIPVKTADDLPRHTYKVSGTALEILNDSAKFETLLDQRIADLRSDLEKYEIQDTATLREYYEALVTAYRTKKDFKSAEYFSSEVLKLLSKAEDKAMHGHSLLATIAAYKVSSDQRDPKFIEVFKKELKERVSKQPIELIRDRLVALRTQAGYISRELIESSIFNSVQPLFDAAQGELSGDLVGTLTDLKYTLDWGLPMIPHAAEVYGEILDAHANVAKRESKWEPRLVELASDAQAQPVPIAVWDSGVDVSLFENNLWRNEAETANSKDDDGNGFIDDMHGIAFGLDRYPAVGPLGSLDGLRRNLDQYLRFLKVAEELREGINNDEVQQYQEFRRNLRGEELRTFNEEFDRVNTYIHGTHVASIALAGNPFARLVHITENWPWKDIPDEAPNIELGERWGNNMRQAGDYLRNANVRVVNMSWRLSRAIFLEMLENKKVGTTPEERVELSRKIFKSIRDGLVDAIRSSPDTLFVCGAGNEDNDVDFEEYIPAGLRLPNLLTIGAVNDQDRFADFSSTGKNVVLYANGYRIQGKIPGGQASTASGTSMASPQVANLAAKILALRPDLRPADVITLMRENADPVLDQPGRFIINPKKTIAALGKGG